MRLLFFPLALAVSLAGCNAENFFCGGPPPTNNKPVVPQLLYPIPGITNVPDHAPTMVVAYSLPPASASPIILSPNGGQAVQLGGMRKPPNPLPTPIAKEVVPMTPMYGVALPALKARTTYGVSYQIAGSYCGHSYVNNYNMGSFKTR